MLQTLKIAHTVALSRAKDRALGLTRRTHAQDCNDLCKSLEFELKPYAAAIDIDPQLHENAYQRKEQDHFSKTHSPNLVADFEYYGAVYSNASVHTDAASHVSVYDANKCLVENFTSVRYIGANKILTRKCSSHVGGTTLHLSALVAGMNGNYAHWLLDLLGRLVLIEDRSVSKIRFDKLLIPAGVPAFRESLSALGIGDERTVELEANKPLQFEKLVCISPPRGYSSFFTPGWLIDGYRKRFSGAVESPNKRQRKLYISRKDARTRKFRQESALYDRLQSKGYESIELSEFGFYEKAELFATATNVIGLSGAGMMSVMFCAPGTQVVELFPSNFVNYQYASICSALNHSHHAFVFPNNSLKSKLTRYSGKFDLDVDNFISFLDGL